MNCFRSEFVGTYFELLSKFVAGLETRRQYARLEERERRIDGILAAGTRAD